MGILDTLLNRNIQKAMDKYVEENKRTSMSSNKKTSKLKDFVVKTVGFVNIYDVGRNSNPMPEYDFEEIKRASETDSYIKISLDKYRRQIYKAGYYLKSENPDAVEYINTRFRIMSYATGKPMDIMFQEIADDLITYSNCLLVKTRVKNVMAGIKANGLFGNQPVGGYFRIDPSTVTIQRDQTGNVLSYTQRIANGKEKTFKPTDIIHFYMDKETNNSFGTPKIIAALEDVKILRRLEGNVLAIVHRFAMPIFHWKIGKPQAGFQATDTEITEAKREIEGMSLDGVVITNEKTDIEVVGAQGNAIDASTYLSYFEQRVFTALDTTAAQMGRVVGSGQSADTMESQTHDYIKYVQKTLSIFIENYLISELLMEGGFNPILDDQDIIEYVFNEISLDTKVKIENHELLKYQSNMQTLGEARRNIGAKEDVKQNQLYKNSIEVPAQIKVINATAKAQLGTQTEMAQINSDNAIKLAKHQSKIAATTQQGQGGTGNMSNGKKPSQATNNDVSTRNRPTNQHGTTSAKIKEELEIVERVIRNKKTHKKEYNKFYDRINKLKANISDESNDLDYLMGISIDSFKEELHMYITKSIDEGARKAIVDLTKDGVDAHMVSAANINKSILFEQVDSTIHNIFKDIFERLNKDRSFNNVDAVFNALEYRFRFMLEFILPKSFWYSYLKSVHIAGITEARVEFGSSEDRDKHKEYIDLNDFNLDDIPAFHPFCDCKLKLIK